MFETEISNCFNKMLRNNCNDNTDNVSVDANKISSEFIKHINKFKFYSCDKRHRTIIGLLGKMGSGKTTTQELIKEYYFDKGISEDNILLCNFADGLKELCFLLFKEHLPIESFYGTQEQKSKKHPFYDLSGRYILQTVGTDIVRKFYGEDFWTNYMFSVIENINREIVIVGDIRFDNEVKSIMLRFGTVIKLNNSNDKTLCTHKSEEIDDLYYDFLIENDKSSIDKLKTDVYVALDYFI